MRRLFQECKIGQGNAAVLADSLLRAKPEDLKKVDVIKVIFGLISSGIIGLFSGLGISCKMSGVTRTYLRADSLGNSSRRAIKVD